MVMENLSIETDTGSYRIKYSFSNSCRFKCFVLPFPITAVLALFNWFSADSTIDIQALFFFFMNFYHAMADKKVFSRIIHVQRSNKIISKHKAHNQDYTGSF